MKLEVVAVAVKIPPSGDTHWCTTLMLGEIAAVTIEIEVKEQVTF